MATETMERTRRSTAPDSGDRNDLRRAVDEMLAALAGLDEASERLRPYEALTSLLVEAVLARDVETLEQAAPALRRLEGRRAAGAEAEHAAGADERGRLATLLSVVGTGLDQLAPHVAATRLEPGSRRHRFLRAVAAQPGLSSNKLGKILDLDAPAVSRAGHEALRAGLVAQRKLGRVAEWRLTPRGHQVLEQVGVNEPPTEVPEAVLTASARAAQELVVRLAAEPEPAEERVLAVLNTSLEPLDLDEPEREQVAPRVFAYALHHLANISRGLVGAHERVEPDLAIGELLMEAKGARDFDLLDLPSHSVGSSLSGNSYVVAPDEPDGWVVLGPSRELPRKKEAIVCAREMAKKNGARMVVLDAHGKIKESKNYARPAKMKGRARSKSR